MARKLTRNDVLRIADKVVYAGYCEVFNLVTYADRLGYASGQLGWNYDVYLADDVAICTGYRAMPGRRARNVRKYEEKATRILENRWPWARKEREITRLLHEFAAQA